MPLLPVAAALALAMAADTAPARPLVSRFAPRAVAAASVARRVPAVPVRREASALLLADSLVVAKGARTLTVFHGDSVLRTYRVALGPNPEGDKRVQGDGRTPEGLYYIEAHNPRSRFHLSLRISYPSAADRAEARALGRSPGGDIMIHGLPPAFARVGPAHAETDWTEGCIALTNEQIEELWSLVPAGTPIRIQP